LCERSVSFGLADVARELGVSRPLPYVYFDSAAQLVDEVFRRDLEYLSSIVARTGDGQQPYVTRMQRLAVEYLAHLLDRGAISYLVLREHGMDSPIGMKNGWIFARLVRQLADEMCSALEMSPRAAMVVLELLAAIPEDHARLVTAGRISEKTARENTSRLVGAALDALKIRQKPQPAD
jgi:AcrR family transcriptional regulator